MRILITGSSGYVGWHLNHALSHLGHEIFSFDCVKKSSLGPQIDSYFIQASSHDLHEVNSIDRNLIFDAVVHLAAKKSVLESTNNPNVFWKTNVEGSVNIARFVAERKIPIFINASSAAVYGNNTEQMIDSKTQVNPKSVYGETKAIAENLIRENLNFEVTFFYNLRFFNIAGYADTCKVEIPDVNIFPKVASALRGGTNFALNGNDFDTRDGTCIRDFIHVRDVVKAIISCLEVRNLSKEFFQTNINVCSGVGTSMLEVIRLMENQSRDTLRIEFLPRREEDPKEVIGDPTAFIELINHEKLIDITCIAESTWRAHL